MDVCTLWEIDNILEYLPYTDRNLWESQRLIGYLIAKSNFKNIKGFEDIAKFKWNEKVDEKHNIEISDDEIRRLKELSKKWENTPSMTQETSQPQVTKSSPL